MRGIATEGSSFLEGAWKGAIVGAVGGAFSYVGGGTFLNNFVWGMGQGAATGALDAALWGNDIGKSMLYGAAIGGAFAAATSGLEAYENKIDGYGFKTNEGVIRNLSKEGEYNELIYFAEERFGLGTTISGEQVYSGYEPYIEEFHGSWEEYTEYGILSNMDTREISFRDEAFLSGDHFKAGFVHEHGHFNFDLNGVKSYPKGHAYLRKDGAVGYAMEIYNAGQLHINPKYLRRTNLMWNEIGFEKWYYMVPRRFPKVLNKAFPY